MLALEVNRGLEGERRRVEAEGRSGGRRASQPGAARDDGPHCRGPGGERGWIARELHDEFGQHLASVLLGLRLVEQAGVADEAREAMAELVHTINAAISQLRTLAIELRPTALDDFGLVAALERLTESYSRRTGISSSWPSAIEDACRQTETTVYRVVQEGLTNVRSTRARAVVVRGKLRGDEFVVRR